MPAAVVLGRRAASAGSQEERLLTGADGSFALACPSGWGAEGTVMATVGSLRSRAATGVDGEEVLLVVRPAAVVEQVTVTTTRSAVALGPQAETVVALDTARLQQFPALTLDERLRQVAGFELFRRSSSWVANPTSQGVSLRGLGSTAASRTLILADGAPLNDPFGGWVHWNEIPPDAIEGVNIATGGGSDLYGSSALGGVIDILPTRPERNQFAGTLAGAAEGTTDAHGRLDLAQQRWGESVAGEGFRTAGYLPTAPQFVGLIDRAANVHYQTARVVLEHRFGREDASTRSDGSAAPSGEEEGGSAGAHAKTRNRAFVTGNLLNEARGNGTIVQTNGSRIWRWLAGDEWSAGERVNGRVRVFGSNEGYRQSFSSIDATRSVETLTRLQRTGTQEVGGSADASLQWGHAAVVLGADVRDLRANDVERPISRGLVSSVQTTPARQRFVGGFGEALGTWKRWSGAASLRVDQAENLQTIVANYTPAGVSTTSTVIADRSETVVSPRLGLVREAGHGVELHATGFRAFRAPTMNELYRQGQVGQELTLANAQLRSERATGVEGGASWRTGTGRLATEATYFWTEINRPVSAVLVSSTATTITNRRENLGQIQSQGVELRVQLNEGHAWSAGAGYQLAYAVVTGFSAQPALVDKWIPQVPRQSVTMQVRGSRARWGTVTIAGRASGQAFDDSSNLYPLHRFFALDAYGERSLSHGWLAFISVQNVLNQRMEVARTPLPTLGNPVLAQGGVRFGWGGR